MTRSPNLSTRRTLGRRLVGAALLGVLVLSTLWRPDPGVAASPLAACSANRPTLRPCLARTACPRGRVKSGAKVGRRIVCVRIPKCKQGTRLNPARTRCVKGPVTPSGSGTTRGQEAGGSGASGSGLDPTVTGSTADGGTGGSSGPATGPAGRIAPLPGGRVLWGAYASGSYLGVPNAPFSMLPIDDFEQRAGKRVSIVHWGQPWYIDGKASSFPTAAMTSVRQRGSIPMLDWGSWDSKRDRVVQPSFRLSAIAAGNHDAYVRKFAAEARAWGHPVFLSLDPEMNGHWPAWSEQVNGNAPGDFVRMWRHVHAIFDQVGATNVTWVWQVNTKYAGSTPIQGLYPGDAQVDWVGISGYGWGNHPDRNNGWITFNKLFSPIMADITAVAPSKPVMIAETGASDWGGSKAAWITEALTNQVPKVFRSIRAFVWFNAFDYPYDWAIQSNPAAQAAFAAGIGLPIYARNEFADLS